MNNYYRAYFLRDTIILCLYYKLYEQNYINAFYGKVLSQVKTSSWTVACKELNKGHSYHAI